jgi:hypothetical protein
MRAYARAALVLVGIVAAHVPSVVAQQRTSAANVEASLTVSILAGDTLPNIITFAEYPTGTFITDQYASLGIVFGGDAPFIATDGSNPTSPMSASLVIEHLDVVEQLHLGLAAAVEAIGRLTLHRRKERSVAASAHRARDPVRIQHPLIVFARIRAALIEVMQQARIRAPPLQHHAEGPSASGAGC